MSVLLLAPGALLAALAFDRGGFFPDSIGLVVALVGVVLAGRMLLARDPVESVSGPALVAGGALSLLAAWTLLSAGWSEMEARALLEFDRVVLYALVFWTFATIGRTPGRLRVLARGLAAGIAVVCVAGLVSRVLPALLSAPPNIEPERLSWPVTYWNGLGLLAAVGLVLALHHAADAREPALVRAVAAVLAPLLVATLVLTFSRAALGGGVLALLAYLVLARPAGLLAALGAIGPATAITVVAVLDADLLASATPTSAAAIDQGERLAPVLAACAVGAGVVQLALMRLAGRARARVPARPAAARRRLAVGLATVLVAGLAASAAAGDLPGRVETEYRAFVDGKDVSARETRSRLVSVGNNGRLEHWDVALEGFRADPLRGSGAGTYELQWARHRSSNFTVLDGHSLYLEILGELGLPGLLLLATFLAASLAGLARRVRGPDRAVGAALLACAGLWAAHAAVDWDWELTAVSLWVFAVAGIGLARPLGAGRAQRRPPRWPARAGLAAAVLVVTATPAVVALAQERLDDAVEAARRGDCHRAVRAADASRDLVASRPDPYEVLAYCELRAGRPAAAVAAMRTALGYEPRTARLHYGLAIALAIAGADPGLPARRANELDPRDLRFRAAAGWLGDDDERERWARRAAGLTGTLVGLDPR